MEDILKIFGFILILWVLVFIHELGHFIACKLLKIEVEEFGFGIPPRIWTMFERGGTKFTLNLIPLGGFVRPKGETDPDVEGSFFGYAAWKRITVFMAGPVMNLLAAVLIFITIYGIVGYLPDRNRVEVISIVPGLPAEAAGMQAGDILVSIADTEIHSIEAVRPIVYTYLGEPMEIVIEREGTRQAVSITPLLNPGEQGALGIGMNFASKPYTVGAAIPEGFKSLYEYVRQTFGTLGRIVQGTAAPGEARVAGFIGMFEMYSLAQEGTLAPGVPNSAQIMLITASISISLGIMNLLPIPALDGGRILFALPELLFRRRIPPKYEMAVNFVSFVLLIGLMLFINGKELLNLFGKLFGKLFP